MAGQERTASTTWEGDLRSGKGQVTLESSGVAGPLPVSFPARFEAVTEGQTSPEELIAAAHASCFSMALANGLAQAGNAPDRLDTSVTITLDRVDGAPTITTAAITVRGKVPGITEEQFLEAAHTAEQNCPVSRALKGSVELSLDAALA